MSKEKHVTFTPGPCRAIKSNQTKRGVLSMNDTKEKELEELKDAIDYLTNIANLESDTRYCVDVLIKEIVQILEDAKYNNFYEEIRNMRAEEV